MTGKDSELPDCRVIDEPCPALLPRAMHELLAALDEALRANTPSHRCGPAAWVVGGAVRDAVANLAPLDFDLGFPCRDDAMEGAHWIEHLGGDRIRESPRHVKFWVAGVGCVDVITRELRSPEETVRMVDFTACAAAWYLDEEGRGRIAMHERFREDVGARRLVPNNLWAPRSTLARAERFVERHWTISNEDVGRIRAAAAYQDSFDPDGGEY